MTKYTSCSIFLEKYWFWRKLYNFSFLPIYKEIGQDLQKIVVVPFRKSCKALEIPKCGCVKLNMPRVVQNSTTPGIGLKSWVLIIFLRPFGPPQPQNIFKVPSPYWNF